MQFGQPPRALVDLKLQRGLEHLFAQRLVPDDRIAGAHSIDRAEDGTLVLMLDLEGGRMMVVSAAPGKRLALTVHE